MLFRPGHFRRATALLTAVSHLALIGCSSSPPRQEPAEETNPPVEWDASITRSDGTTAPLNLAHAVRSLGGLDGTSPVPPLVPDIRGFYVGQTRCGANPISIEALILGASPDSIRGVASLSDPTTPIDTFFVVYEFRGSFDGGDVGLRPARLLASGGLPLPGDLVGVPIDGDRIQSRFEGDAGGCRPFTLQQTQKVAWDEARYLERNFGEVVASFLPSAPAPPTVRRSTPPPAVASAPSVRKLSPEAADEVLKSATAGLPPSGNEFFSPPSQAPKTSWVPSWMTRENVNTYGGYVAAGALLFLSGVLAYKYGGSSGTGGSSASSAPDPAPSSDASDRLYQQQEEERERAARQQQGGGSGFYVPPIDPFYDVPN